MKKFTSFGLWNKINDLRKKINEDSLLPYRIVEAMKYDELRKKTIVEQEFSVNQMHGIDSQTKLYCTEKFVLSHKLAKLIFETCRDSISRRLLNIAK